jgi:vacuolar-type H+-ATPase subunit E/Vma4
MRDMAGNNEHPILEGILGEARAEAERIRSEAAQKAAGLKESTDSQCRRILAEARERAESQKQTMLQSEETSVAAELRRIELRAREKLNEELLAKLRDRLLKLQQSPAYREICRDLIVEAAAGIGTPKVLVCVSSPESLGSRGKSGIDRGLLSEAQELLARKGLQVELELAEDESLRGPGIVCRDPAGRLVFDNRFEARMRRMRRELVRIIAEEIGTEDGKAT